jgi:serine/threonine-protein kinase
MTGETSAAFRRFGSYALLQLSGAGSMGRVDVALATRPGNLARVCVLKRMHSELRTPEEERRFRREAKIALRLSHGSIARTLDVEEIEGELCLLQEFVHGTNLAQLEHRAASREQLPIPLSLYITREVARALAYAHSFDGSGIVHRDVTPDNIMLSFSGEVKLVDFGIAKSLGEQTMLTEVGAVVGRPIYTAPEVVAGGPASPRSDIYSLGVVLWQLLTGRTFPDRALQGPPGPPSAANPAVAAELDRLVTKAIDPDPALRYERADELQVSLSRLLPPDFVGDRALADFLGVHFAVETEKRMLTEDISRAQAQLAAEAEATTVTPTTESVGAVVARSLAVQATGRRRALLPFAVAGLAVAAAMAVYVSRQSSPSPTAPPRAPAEPAATFGPVQVPPSPALPSASAPAPSETGASPSPASPPVSVPERVAHQRSQVRSARKDPAVQGESAGAAELAKQAEDKLRGGDLKTAYARAREAVRSGGGSRARMVLGKVLFAQNRLTLAEQEFAEIVRVEAGNAEAARYLANVRRELAKGERP